MRTAALVMSCVVAGLTAAAPGAHADPTSPLDTLVDAAAQRLQTADPVAALKWQTRSNIEDPPRVDQVLATVSADAQAHGIDSAYVRQVFTDQINATEALEYSRFAQWKLDPGSAPTSAPDLSASRATIHRLNQQMVDAIAAQWDLLHSPACAAALHDAMNDVTAARQLEPLTQQALGLATRSYCG
jgi:chorismate mutase